MRGILFSIPQGLRLVSDFTCQVFFFHFLFYSCLRKLFAKWWEQIEWVYLSTLGYMAHPRTAAMSFPGGASGKEPTCQCRRHKKCGFNLCIRKIPWRRTQQSSPVILSLENPLGREAWQATVCEVAKSRTWLKWLGMMLVCFFFNSCQPDLGSPAGLG